jgi:hypothetical protein
MGKSSASEAADAKGQKKSRKKTALMAVAERGDAAALAQELKKATPEEIEATDANGWGALAHALDSRAHECARLLARVSDANAKEANKMGKSSRDERLGLGDAGTERTPLMMAAAMRGPEALATLEALLASRGARPDERDAFGATALMHAVRFGSDEAIERLAKAKGLDARSGSGLTALHHAAKAGRPRAMKTLLDAGAKTDAVSRGLTLLMWAASGGDAECVRLALPFSDPKATSLSGGRKDAEGFSSRGLTAAMVAARDGQARSLAALLDVSDPTERDESGIGLLAWAAVGSSACVEALRAIEWSAPAIGQAMRVACVRRKPEALRALAAMPLAQEAARSATHQGRAPLHAAAAAGFAEGCEILAAFGGFDMEWEGRTPLTAALREESLSSASALAVARALWRRTDVWAERDGESAIEACLRKTTERGGEWADLFKQMLLESTPPTAGARLDMARRAATEAQSTSAASRHSLLSAASAVAMAQGAAGAQLVSDVTAKLAAESRWADMESWLEPLGEELHEAQVDAALRAILPKAAARRERRALLAAAKNGAPPSSPAGEAAEGSVRAPGKRL